MLIHHRPVGENAAIVFIHGFSGDPDTTWSQFPKYLMAEPRLNSWGIYAFGYPSSRGFDLPGLWAADPGIPMLATGLATALSNGPLVQYEALVLIAHSMGGLLAQRALLDRPELAARVQHLFLFGTPSAGLQMARFGGWWKRQIRDMDAEGEFITELDADRRRAWFSETLPFRLHAVAGLRDEFVPEESSLHPFPPDLRHAVPGNHLEMVKPDSPDHLSVQLVKEALIPGFPAVINTAMIAVEQRRFQQVVDTLLPRSAGLDDRSRGDLALALDGLGRGGEALEMLQQNPRCSSTDAMGILGGRIKRRWLIERQQADWSRARELYRQALDLSETAQDHDQAYYHAINVAFLDLMALPEAAAVPQEILDMAAKAFDHCTKATDGHWRQATLGEAMLILGKLDDAVRCYTVAIMRSPKPRDAHSMFSQAMRVAERMHGEGGADKVAALFNSVAGKPS